MVVTTKMTLNQAIKDLEEVRGWNDVEYQKRINVIKIETKKLQLKVKKLEKRNQELKQTIKDGTLF